VSRDSSDYFFQKDLNKTVCFSIQFKATAPNSAALSIIFHQVEEIMTPLGSPNDIPGSFDVEESHLYSTIFHRDIFSSEER
jgi:hypothetical protein